jgi:small GTP-binding protein
MSNYKVLNIVLLGKDFSGKSNLARSITHRELYSEYVPTIGVDYIFRINYNTKTKFVIWDLAGMERFRSLLSGYVKTSHVVCLCFANGDIDSLNSIIEIYDYYKKLNYMQNKNIIIVVTKYDNRNVMNEKNVSKVLAEFNNENNYPIVYTSSIQHIGILDLIKLFESTDYKKIQSTKKDIKVDYSFALYGDDDGSDNCNDTGIQNTVNSLWNKCTIL